MKERATGCKDGKGHLKTVVCILSRSDGKSTSSYMITATDFLLRWCVRFSISRWLHLDYFRCLTAASDIFFLAPLIHSLPTSIADIPSGTAVSYLPFWMISKFHLHRSLKYYLYPYRGGRFTENKFSWYLVFFRVLGQGCYSAYGGGGDFIKQLLLFDFVYLFKKNLFIVYHSLHKEAA